MKSTTQSSIASVRRPLIAATVALLASAAFVSAQTTGAAGSTSAGSSQKNPSSTSPSSPDYSRSTTTPSTDTSSSSSTAPGAATGRTTTSSDKLSWGDRHFVNKAADGGMDEIALAKLATEKASNAEVKSFAQKLVDDHQMVANELETIASQKNVKLDKDNDHDRAYKRLSKKSGSDFDQEFVEHMIDEHEKTIKMFEKAAKDAKDSDVRSFASKHIDHLRDHLKTAENLRQTIMPTGRSDSGSSRSSTRSSSESYDTSSSSTTPSTSSSSSDTSRSSTSTPRDSTSSSSSSTDTPSTTPRRDTSR